MAIVALHLDDTVSRVRFYPVSYKDDPLLAVTDMRLFLCNRQLERLLNKSPDFLSDSFRIGF